MTNNERGFTLIELMATLAILALIVVIAVPSIGSIIDGASNKAEAASIDMIERAGSIADTAGLDHDYSDGAKYSVDELIEAGYLDLDRDDPLAQGGAYVQKEGAGNTYKYYGSGDQPDYSNEVVENSVVSDVFEIVKATPPDGRIIVGDAVDYSVTVKNIGDEEAWLEVVAGFMDDDDEYYDHWAMSDGIEPGETYTLDMAWDSTGAEGNTFYDTYLEIHDGVREPAGTIGFLDTFYLAETNDWSYVTADDWFIQNDRTIGNISELLAENVTLDDTAVYIDFPANSYDSGQVKTHDVYGYGSYEARMQVPPGDANLSGFFMYAPEDTEHEIDMEVLNIDGKWQLWMTVHNINHVTYDAGMYEEPGEVFKKKVDLDFDPSAGMHDYRIDFYPTYVAFTVDDEEVGRWNERFDFKKMHVFVGSFYSHWLSKTQFETDQTMDIEWVRFGYKD